MIRPQAEVSTEIAALRALKPTGPWARKTAYIIEQVLAELEHGIDRTAEEWNELPDEVQMAIEDAAVWKSGASSQRPSSGWEGLVS